MPLSFKIYPRRGLVHVAYSGEVRLDDTAEAFAAYMAHPDARPDQKHLIDLSAVTGIEEDFPRLMALQAQKAGGLSIGAIPAMLVYFAPTPMAKRMAQMIRRSWDGISAGPIVAVLEEERAVLDLLGCPESSIAELERRVAEE